MVERREEVWRCGGAGIKEVGGFCGVRVEVSNAYRREDWSGSRDICLVEFKHVRRPDLRV